MFSKIKERVAPKQGLKQKKRRLYKIINHYLGNAYVDDEKHLETSLFFSSHLHELGYFIASSLFESKGEKHKHYFIKGWEIYSDLSINEERRTLLVKGLSLPINVTIKKKQGEGIIYKSGTYKPLYNGGPLIDICYHLHTMDALDKAMEDILSVLSHEIGHYFLDIHTHRRYSHADTELFASAVGIILFNEFFGGDIDEMLEGMFKLYGNSKISVYRDVASTLKWWLDKDNGKNVKDKLKNFSKSLLAYYTGEDICLIDKLKELSNYFSWILLYGN